MKIAKELREMMEAELVHGLPGWFKRDFVDDLFAAAPWMLTVLERVPERCCLTCAYFSDCGTVSPRTNCGERYQSLPGAPGSEEGGA